MKKTIGILICTLLISIMASTTSFAADALYRMLHTDDVEQFRKDQDAIIIGQITQDKQDRFTVKVLKVLSGKVSGNTILVDNSLTYSGVDEPGNKPMVNDYCFLSLKKYGAYYKMAWYTAKADSGDYKTLKLLYDNKMGDLPAIQWYVNSGGKDKDFSFGDGAIYVKQSNGDVVKIYSSPEEKIEEPISATSVQAVEEQTTLAVPASVEQKVEKAQTSAAVGNSIGNYILIISAAGVLVFVALLMFLKAGKNKKE